MAMSEDWLTGGGEMGARTRAFDWSTTPIGPREQWPQSLKTAVSIMLGCQYPLLIWWGPELIHFYNDAYRPVLGTRHPRALARPAPLVWSEAWPLVGPQADAVMREGKSYWNEELLIVMTRNGYPEEVYMTFSYGPILNDAGEVGGVFCACTEETPRVLARRRLATLRALAERSYQTRSVEEACEMAAAELARNPHDVPFALLYLLDEDGQRAHLRGSSGIASGHAACPQSIRIDSDDTPWPFREVSAQGTGRTVTDLQARFGSLPGGPWPESAQQALALPLIKPGQQQLAGFFVAGVSPRLPLDDSYHGFFDLVASQCATAVGNAQAYAEERKRAEMLAELDRAKTAFFSNVSHEFRTPLTLMLGPLEEALARDGDLAPAAREEVTIAHRNALRLLKLVNTLLDFSRIEAGRIEASYEPVDLPQITAELASIFRSAIERAGMRLLIDCPPLPSPVWVDREMWEKVVLNLLSNAFKFSFEGTIAVQVAMEGDGRVQLTVSDTGTGIADADLPHIFERFHRVRGARSRSHEGSGIGLALVQELVKLHGGTIDVVSKLGQGTAFTVHLPMGSAHLPQDRIAAPRERAWTAIAAEAFVEEAVRWLPEYSSPASTAPPRAAAVDIAEPGADDGDGPRPRILLADDNADMREYVKRLLAGRYQVDAVADGDAALRLAREEPPDLVLSDIMMPGLDGVALLRELRADPRTRHLSVILLSARAGEEAMAGGLDAGADDYLVKPFTARELIARVHAHLERVRERRRATNQLSARLDELKKANADIRDARRASLNVLEDAVEARNLAERLYGELREHGSWLRGQRAALESALNDTSLETSLGDLVRTANEAFGADTRAAFYLSDDEGTTLHHIVGMPPEYAKAVDGFKIGLESLACGLATPAGRPVLTTDVKQEPLWQPWLWLAERFDYRACWGFPLRTTGGKCIGSLAIYSRQPREATPRDLELASILTHTASIIISRHRESVVREKAEQAARASADRLRRVVDTDAVAVLFFTMDGRLIDANDGFVQMTGYSREQVAAGRLHWRDMTPPEWVGESEAQMERLKQTGRLGPYEKDYFRADGSRSRMLFSGRDLGDGTVVEFAIDLSDRTRRADTKA
jgi:PAS domain S-box-containing protein